MSQVILLWNHTDSMDATSRPLGYNSPSLVTQRMRCTTGTAHILFALAFWYDSGYVDLTLGVLIQPWAY